MEIGLDGKIHEDAKCIFEMELEDIVNFAADDDENYNSMVWSNIIIVLKYMFHSFDQVLFSR